MLDLMERWHELTAQGTKVTPAELCKDCPELIPELEHLLRLERGPGSRGRGQTRCQPARVPRAVQALDRQPRDPGVRWAREAWARSTAPGNQRLDRMVAVKVIKDGLAGPQELARFESEARALAALDHPQIVRVYEVGRWYSEERKRELPFLSLEYIEGKTLDDRLGFLRPLPAEAARLVLLLAQAVQHSHEKGVLHRDLKPGNVMLAAASAYGERNCAWGLPKLTDFGLALRRRRGRRRRRLPAFAVYPGVRRSRAGQRRESGCESRRVRPGRHPLLAVHGSSSL